MHTYDSNSCHVMNFIDGNKLLQFLCIGTLTIGIFNGESNANSMANDDAEANADGHITIIVKANTDAYTMYA